MPDALKLLLETEAGIDSGRRCLQQALVQLDCAANPSLRATAAEYVDVLHQMESLVIELHSRRGRLVAELAPA